MPLKKDLGQWISHFKDSDAPQFKGKSEEQRKNMALAAFRKKYGSLNEAYENITNNELASYVGVLQNEIGAEKNPKKLAMLKQDLEDVKNELKKRKTLKEQEDPVDTITMDIPLFLRMLEYSREDASQDMDLHDVTEKANALGKEKGILSMEDYEAITGGEVTEVVVTDDADKAEDIANKTGEEVKVVKKGTIQEGREYDYEGKMAQAQLLSIVKNSRDLFNMIGKDDQLKSWVQSKLTKAEDYLDSVRTYLEGESLTSTAPVVVQEDKVRDEEGTNLNIGDVVKAGDGRIYQIIFSYSENKPFLVPFDLKRRKPTTLRTKVYFDSGDLITKKLNKIMDYSATKGGFMK